MSAHIRNLLPRQPLKSTIFNRGQRRLASSVNASRPNPQHPTAPPPPSAWSRGGFSRAQFLGLEIALVFGSAALGFILSSTLRENDLPLLGPLSRMHLRVAGGDKSQSLSDDPEAKGPGTLHPEHGSTRAYKAAIGQLQRHFAAIGRSDDVSTDESDLEDHGISQWSYHAGHKPSVVVWARTAEDVSEVMKIANKHKVPITPFSGGTSLEGHFSSPYGGISLDMSPMSKILRISEEDGDCTVEPGVKWEDLNAELDRQGIPLFFPIDPGPGATIGGMIATGCSGTNAVRYGTSKAEWILNATVVLPSGEIIKTRQRARKSSAGWDTTKLFIGSEGTLGIVTEATLRLAPKLPTKVAVVSFGDDVESAVRASTEVVNAGVPVQCVEFLDGLTMKAINDSGAVPNKKFAHEGTLFFKLQGTDKSMEEVSQRLLSITSKHGGRGFEFAKTNEEAEALWQARKAALWSVMALEEGAKVWTTDVCVPISKIASMIRETTEDFKNRGIVACHFGHVGDGNVHSLALFKNDEELQVVKNGVHDMVERAISMGGTCTGEHGVGLGKVEYLEHELGTGTVHLMETIKRTLDPNDLLNPGKLYPNLKPEQRD